MRLGWVAGAVLAVTAGIQPVAAQDLRGPRELPPSGFAGQQYVDSRGCVFLRGGLGGTVTWVPRVGRDRRQLCGFPPSFSPEPAVVVATAPAPAPEPAPRPVVRRPGDPIDTIASLTTPPRIRAVPAPAPQVTMAAPAPAIAAPAAPAPRVAAAPAPSAATPGCPAHAPYGERVELRDGRTALLCVLAPGNIPDFARRVAAETGRQPMPAPQPQPAPRPEVVARAATAPVTLEAVGATEGIGPTYLPDGRMTCPAFAPNVRAVPLRGGGSTALCFGGPAGGATVAVAAQQAPQAAQAARAAARALENPGKPPAGYRMAWRDDRLNPNRGLGTAQGQAQQDQVWTRKVPARLVTDAPGGKARVTASASGAQAPQVTTSASGARAAAPAAAGRFFVQVGSFGVAGNADNARVRLAGMGLPVATGRGSIKGKPVEVVHAGPFATAAQAQAALAAARGAGFRDAFVR